MAWIRPQEAWWRAVLLGTLLAAMALSSGPWAAQSRRLTHSAYDATFSPDGRLGAVSDFTADAVAIVEPTRGRLVRTVSVASPKGVCWVRGRVYATQYLRDSVVEIAPEAGKVLRVLSVGAYPSAIATFPGSRRLLVGNSGDRSVTVLDLRTGRTVGRLHCTGEPAGIAASPDGRLAVVPNLLPTGDATREDNAATVGIYDLTTYRRVAEIHLPAGSANVRGVAITPDGRWACLVHALGRYNLPTTQLDRGWINTNALSVLDLEGLKHYVTVLLDQPQEGAADPWDVEIAPDGKTVWVTLSGVHEVARLDFARMMRWAGGGLPADHPLNRTSPEWAITTRNIWQEIRADPTKRAELVNDLSALYVGDLIERVRLPGRGPRGLSVARDGKSLLVAQYFTGDVALADASGRVRRAISLGASPPPSPARRGERIFHDGTLAFQHWLSCSTCHPDGRADGLNWDLLNDGIGNPKNTRSLLLAHQRGPMMSHGVRSNLTVAATAGFRYILFRSPQPNEVPDVMAYIRSMRPLPSPRRIGPGRTGLSSLARQGKLLFESPKTKCLSCHHGLNLTDRKLYDVGTRGPYDTDSKFVTPPLVELWRTAPYLHDGRAVTMRDVLKRFNERDRHGVTSHLSSKELDALAEYLLSL